MSSHPEIKGETDRKDDKLLSLLKDVYVDSQDPMSSLQVKDAGTHQKPKEFRLPKDHQFDMMKVKNIPKGKISIVVALMLLNSHKLYPDTWTAKKIADKYHLEQQDVNSLLKYFVTFEVKKSSPPKAREQYKQNEETLDRTLPVLIPMPCLFSSFVAC